RRGDVVVTWALGDPQGVGLDGDQERTRPEGGGRVHDTARLPGAEVASRRGADVEAGRLVEGLVDTGHDRCHAGREPVLPEARLGPVRIGELLRGEVELLARARILGDVQAVDRGLDVVRLVDLADG